METEEEEKKRLEEEEKAGKKPLPSDLQFSSLEGMGFNRQQVVYGFNKVNKEIK